LPGARASRSFLNTVCADRAPRSSSGEVENRCSGGRQPARPSRSRSIRRRSTEPKVTGSNPVGRVSESRCQRRIREVTERALGGTSASDAAPHLRLAADRVRVERAAPPTLDGPPLARLHARDLPAPDRRRPRGPAHLRNAAATGTAMTEAARRVRIGRGRARFRPTAKSRTPRQLVPASRPEP
jgi:hypothetical protein